MTSSSSQVSTEKTTKPRSSRQRIQWVDYAKGLGIILVVIGHTLRGLADGLVVDSLELIQGIDTWLYAFHMPLFFFLSGIFAEQGLHKSLRQFGVEKILKKIFYPYCIWTFIVAGIRTLLGKSDFSSLSEFIHNFWRIIYQPIGIFWFLYTLILISFLYFILRKMKISLLMVVLFAVALYATNVILGNQFPWDPLQKVCIYFIYYAVGALAYSFNLLHRLLNQQVLILNLILGYLWVSLATHFQWVSAEEPFYLVAFPGILASISLACLGTQGSKMQFLEYIGQRSLEIYVGHTIFSSVMRAILFKLLHIESLGIHAVAGVLAGLGGSLALAHFARRFRAGWIFTLA